MARVNQGIYHKIRKEGKSLITQSRSLIDECFDSDTGFFDGDLVTAWDFLEQADDLYTDIKSLREEIKTVLKTQKFEDEDKVGEYENLRAELKDIASELKNHAKELRSFDGLVYTRGEELKVSQMEIFR